MVLTWYLKYLGGGHKGGGTLPYLKTILLNRGPRGRTRRRVARRSKEFSSGKLRDASDSNKSQTTAASDDKKVTQKHIKVRQRLRSF